MQKKLRVIFIGGSSRSGSTLLGRMLGQIGGFLHVGELHQIWKKSFGQDWICECGQGFKDCPFWVDVVGRALGNLEQAKLKSIRAMKHSVERVLRKPALLRWALRTPAYWANVRRYAALVRRLLEAVQHVSACEAVVDSSKNAAHGFVLCNVENLELSVVHLVRDSRAVAHSLRRKKVQAGPKGRMVYMPRSGIIDGCRIWRRENTCTLALKNASTHYLLLRYEDLAQQPYECMLQIAERLNLPAEALGFISGRTVDLGPSHSLSGNPMRFQQGTIEVRPDDEWRWAMPWCDKAMVTALTWRLLRRFGYRSGPRHLA